jgi:Tol biopolymer transport system component
MDRDGTHRRQLTHPLLDVNPPVYDGQPSWSPDGRWIVFTRSTTHSPTTLFMVPAAGGRAHSLRLVGLGPVWLGKRIAYLDENYTDIWTVNLHGGNRRRLAHDKAIFGLTRSSGGSLAYVGSRGSPRTSGTVVHIVDPAGRGTSFPIPARASSLVWSPDGKRLLLSASQGTAPAELYVVDASGRHFRRLTRNMGYVWKMAWLGPART